MFWSPQTLVVPPVSCTMFCCFHLLLQRCEAILFRIHIGQIGHKYLVSDILLIFQTFHIFNISSCCWDSESLKLISIYFFFFWPTNKLHFIISQNLYIQNHAARSMSNTIYHSSLPATIFFFFTTPLMRCRQIILIKYLY